MKKLRDYTGPFSPNTTYEDFSRDVLLRLLTLYAEYLQRVDGVWYLAVKDKLGDDVAFECDQWVWERLQTWELDKVTKLFKIEGNDVIALMKWFQVSPWMRICKGQLELKDRDHGVVTITHCPSLTALEKEGQGREQRICYELEPVFMKIIADFFNPKIEVNPLKLPPRKSNKKVACQWEFSLELSCNG